MIWKKSMETCPICSSKRKSVDKNILRRWINAVKAPHTLTSLYPLCAPGSWHHLKVTSNNCSEFLNAHCMAPFYTYCFMVFCRKVWWRNPPPPQKKKIKIKNKKNTAAWSSHKQADGQGHYWDKTSNCDQISLHLVSFGITMASNIWRRSLEPRWASGTGHLRLRAWAYTSSPPSAAYIRQWPGSALVQVMACRLSGAKPLPEPVLTYHQLNPC